MWFLRLAVLIVPRFSSGALRFVRPIQRRDSERGAGYFTSPFDTRLRVFLTGFVLLNLGLPAQAATLAYIPNSGSNTVSVIDTATNTVIATIPVQNRPTTVAVHPAGTSVYVGHVSGNVSVIDTSTNTVIATVPIGDPGEEEPLGLAVHPNGSFVYVTRHNTFDVLVIDTTTNTVVATIPVGFEPHGVAVHPAGTFVYVTSLNVNRVAVINASDNKVFATVPLTSFRPTGVAVHPGGRLVYVATESQNLSVIDADTLAEVASVPLGCSSFGVVVHPAGKFVYVTNPPCGTVSVIDATTNTLLASVPVGPRPAGISVHPTGTAAYVANSGSNTVSVLDTVAMTVSATVAVGNFPVAFGQSIGSVIAGGLHITTFSPTQGGNAGKVTVSILGRGFSTRTTVRFVEGAEVILTGQNTIVTGGTRLETTFDLRGQFPRMLNLEVINADGTVATGAEPFEIQSGGRIQLWADVIGRELLRINRPERFAIVYENRGNIDAPGMFLWLLLPKNAVLDLGPEFVSTSFPAGIELQPPLSLETPDAMVITLLRPNIRPGEVRTAVFSMTVPTEGFFRFEFFLEPQPEVIDALTVTAVTSQSVAPLALESSSASTSSSLDVAGDFDGLFKLASIAIKAWDEVSLFAGGGHRCDESAPALRRRIDEEALRTDSPLKGWTTRLITIQGLGSHQMVLVTSPDGLRYYGVDVWVKPAIAQMVPVNGGWLVDPLVVLREPANPIVLAQGIIILPFFLGPIWRDLDADDAEIARLGAQNICAVPAPFGGFRLRFVTSVDPNEKIGPAGTQERHRYVAGTEPLTYAIAFENVETATAAAQQVVITDQLDPVTMDLSTLRFVYVEFGGQRLVPESQNNITADVDLRPATDLLVRIRATLDPTTGLLTWRFVALDPATGRPSEDPLKGFLPPNLRPPEGEGRVIFTVMSRRDLPTGSEVRNSAAIVFDTNPPIGTHEVFNTLDNNLPASHVLPLSESQPGTEFEVQWAGSDEGSGIQDYSIFVQEGGGSFVPWLRNTFDTSGMFVGQAGKTYSFLSIARDAAGNIEDKPRVAEATTRIAINRRPVANAGPDQILECASPNGTQVILNGFASFDPDGDVLSFNWEDASGVVVGTAPTLNVTLPFGAHTLRLVVQDGRGGTSDDTVMVVVRDTRPPNIVNKVTHTTLWPPNHNFVDVGFSQSATDICHQNPAVSISVTSDEPAENNNTSDTLSPNATFINDSAGNIVGLRLRPQRNGGDDGRVYLIQVTATDRAGNTNKACQAVVVPHDQSSASRASVAAQAARALIACIPLAHNVIGAIRNSRNGLANYAMEP